MFSQTKKQKQKKQKLNWKKSPWSFRAAIIAAIIAGVFGIIYILLDKYLPEKKPKLEPNLNLVDAVPLAYIYAHNSLLISYVDLKLKNSGNTISFINNVIVEVIQKQHVDISHTYTIKPPLSIISPLDLLGIKPYVDRELQKDIKSRLYLNLRLKEDSLCRGCHIVPVSETYNIPLSKIDKGNKKNWSIYHQVKEKEPERIVLAFGGDDSCVAQVKIVIEADGKKLDSNPLNILVLEGGLSREVELDSEEIVEMSKKGNMPELTPSLIRNKLESLKIPVPKWLPEK